jgi:hypothetical protein
MTDETKEIYEPFAETKPAPTAMELTALILVADAVVFLVILGLGGGVLW